MRLCLHIGTEKTGTTSVQQFLHHNHDTLVTQGLFYSQVLGRPSNWDIATYSMDTDASDDGLQSKNITTAREHDVFRQKLSSGFWQEVEQARKLGCHTFIISSEHCHSRLSSVGMIRRVNDLLGDHFDSIEILCFLRPQTEVLVSLASTVVRVGQTLKRSFFDNVRADSTYLNYDTLLQRWSEIFGEDNLTVVPFVRHKNSIEFFAEKFQIDVSTVFIPERVNEALSVETMALANAINSVPLESSIISERLARRHWVDYSRPGERLQLPRNLAEQIQSQFRDSNVSVTKRFATVELSDLDAHLDAYPEVGNIDVLDSLLPFAKSIAQLTWRHNARLLHQEGLTYLAESERAESRKNLPNALMFAEKAQACFESASVLEPRMLEPKKRLQTTQQWLSKLNEKVNN